MDVSFSVSLLRNQMGSVIEQAVTAAVETVLGEMVKVVGCKLEEYSKEMTAKEKENESIKKMLELSQCQMKTMRKYLSAVIAKDERQVLINQRNVQKENELNRTQRLPAGQGQTQHFRGMKRTLITSEKTKKPLTQTPSAHPSESIAQPATSSDRLTPKSPNPLELAQESVTRPGREDSFDDTVPFISRESSELAQMKAECRVCPEVESQVERKEDVSDPVWVSRPSSASQGELPAILPCDPQSPLKTAASAAPDTSVAAAWEVPVRAKEEEAEIEIICIKEEPEELEAYSLNPPRSDPSAEQANALPDRTQPLVSEHADELAEASLAAVTSFMYSDAHRQTVAQRQARWRHRMREQSLFEDHKHRKAELKRRSQHRRREREKSLPQPLLAALERERREKNRIRVARWRAKRKLQAGLVTSPPAQFSYPPAPAQPHGDKLHCHPQFSTAPQPTALLFNSPQCEGSTLFSSLPFNSNPLMPDLRHDT